MFRPHDYQSTNVMWTNAFVAQRRPSWAKQRRPAAISTRAPFKNFFKNPEQVISTWQITVIIDTGLDQRELAKR